LPSWIEFHDSTLTALNESASAREVVLDAYVRRWEMVGDRWHGTGWQQLVRIRIENVTDPSVVPAMPVNVDDGDLRATGVKQTNFVPVPMEAAGDCNLRLRLTGNTTVEIKGRGLQVETAGEGRFVEELPDDMKPHQP